MIKLHYQDSQEELVRAAGQMTSLIDSSRMIKSAASSAMSREMLTDCKPDKDHALIHLIAMGDAEHYGANRNGDAFPKEACEKYHPTFVSNGHMFREHKNRDAKTQGIGTIKASCYSPDLGRIELAIWADKKKAADVIEKIASGEPTSYSMSCRVPNDRSSITGKIARTPAEYDEFTKYRMNQYIPEFKKYAFVYNDKPTFFDISYVKNPADRIAHYLEYQMDKAASASVLNGYDLALAEGVALPDFGTGCSDLRKQATLAKLVELEIYLDAVELDQVARDSRYQFCKHAGLNAFRGELSEEQLSAFNRIEPGTLFHKLARRSTILPFTSFVAYATTRTIKAAAADPVVQAARAELGQMFRKLAKASCCDFENLFEPSSNFMTSADLKCSDSIDKMLDQAGEQFSHEPAAVRNRVIEISVGSNPKPAEKCAYSSGNYKEESAILLSMYGHYKLAALKTIESFHGSDTVDSTLLLSVMHGRIS